MPAPRVHAVVHGEVSAGSGLGLTGCVLAAGVIGGEDYEELDRYNRQGRTGRASGRGAQQSRRGSWRYKRWEDLRVARTSVHLASPEAGALWTAGLRQALDQGAWPSGLCVPGMATGPLGVLSGVFSFLRSFNQGCHDPTDGGVRGPSLGGAVQVCQEALAWRTHALAGLPPCPAGPRHLRYPGAAPENWAGCFPGAGARGSRGGGLAVPTAPSPGQGGRAGTCSAGCWQAGL